MSALAQGGTAYPGGTRGTERRDYWLCQLAGWGSFAVVGILSSNQSNMDHAIRFAMAKTACMISGLLLSHLWHEFLRARGWLDRNRSFPFAPILGGITLLSVVQLACLIAADTVFRNGALLSDREALPFVALMLFFLWFGVFLVWTLCYAMVLSRRRALRLEVEKLELEVSGKDAELRALQAQVNPHFFFNSLNSIRALIYQDSDAAAMAVNQLAGMMRHTLQSGQASTARLADELAAVDAYLAIEKLRFDERMDLTVQVEPGLEEVALPPMILQTLVENAVKHGVETSIHKCRIIIAVRQQQNQIVLSVANEGTLAASSASTRLGLANASKRLALLFGPQASCTLRQEDGWVIATVMLPKGPA